MNETMTPKQTLIMWCLLGKQGDALQAEIVPKVEKTDREALVSRGYITCSRRGRAYGLTVEDKGWDWACHHLCDELPPNFQVLRNWLERIHHFLERKSETLAEIIGPASERAAPLVTTKSSSPRPRKALSRPTTRRRKSLTGPQVRARIEKAYLAVTNGRTAESVLLSKLRAELTDLDRATVDAGLLRILQGDENARLGQISDPKTLTPEERDAAFSPGGDTFHLLWMQR
jgi:hypothetical protein